jgi:hypothetical protein
MGFKRFCDNLSTSGRFRFTVLADAVIVKERRNELIRNIGDN